MKQPLPSTPISGPIDPHLIQTDRLWALRRAIQDQGSHPQHHREVMARHRQEWPTLWRAIDDLLR